MKITHEFSTPRNIFEKLIRDYEVLDIRVNGDNVFNFLSTAYHLQEWIKNAPIHSTQQGKRLVSKASGKDCIKLCKEVITAKKTYSVIINDPHAQNEQDYTKLPNIYDAEHYKSGTKEYKLIVGDKEYNPFKLKEEIMDIYKTYFQIK